MSIRVESLHVGTLGLDSGETPVWAWLLIGSDWIWLVDAGLPEPELVERRWRTPCTRGGESALLKELDARGVRPGDVNCVVLTHLHYDHAWNFGLFPATRVIVHRSELIHAVDPVPTHRPWYNRERVADLVRRRRPDELTLVSGDSYEARAGVRLIHLPGHTPGTMGVVVETSAGRVGLPSDAGATYANWHPADPRARKRPLRFLNGSYLPPQIATESDEVCIASLARFKAECDIVLPGHDDRIPRHMPEEWWELPDT